MVDFQYKDSYGVKDLEEIVRLLRAPGGCPWDAEQTHQSIRRNFLEEAYEAVEAIDEGSPEHLKEELGDVLLQVVFHALMEQEAGRFDLDAVADGICKKLIFRHPHVFGEVSVSGTGEVLSNWEELKRKEKGQATNTDALEAVARSLPALWRAEEGQKKAKKAGFDWPDVTGALDKLEEPDRSLVIRFYFYGEKTSALAKACGLTDTAVRLRLHRSRGKLRKYMIERGFDHAE